LTREGDVQATERVNDAGSRPASQVMYVGDMLAMDSNA